MGIGLALTLVNLIGILLDGCSVNPARSLGPAVLEGGAPLSQLWVFLIAPLVGAVLAAGIHMLFYPLAPDAEAPEDSALTEHISADDAGSGGGYRGGSSFREERLRRGIATAKANPSAGGLPGKAGRYPSSRPPCGRVSQEVAERAAVSGGITSAAAGARALWPG